MVFSTRNKRDHVLIDIEGDLRVHDAVALKSRLQELLASGARHVDFNLAGTQSVDSSSLGLLANVKKRLASNGGTVSLVNVKPVVQDILQSTNLDRVFSVYETEEAYDTHLLLNSTSGGFDYWPLSDPGDAPVRRVPLRCAVCGGQEVFGYALSPNHRERIWASNQYLPGYLGIEDRNMNYDRACVAVCAECHMASMDLSDFVVLKDGQDFRKSRLDGDTKMLLMKGISKRKKIMDISVAVGDIFFAMPRTDLSVVSSYRLAAECLRAISIDRAKSNLLGLGFLNFLEGVYSSTRDSKPAFERARAWLTEGLESKREYEIDQRAKGHYCLFIACLLGDRKKETRDSLERLRYFAESTTDSLYQKIISFWHERAQEIWQKHIKNESNAFSL